MQCRRPGSTRNPEGADSYQRRASPAQFAALVAVYSRYTRPSMNAAKSMKFGSISSRQSDRIEDKMNALVSAG